MCISAGQGRSQRIESRQIRSVCSQSSPLDATFHRIHWQEKTTFRRRITHRLGFKKMQSVHATYPPPLRLGIAMIPPRCLMNTIRDTLKAGVMEMLNPPYPYKYKGWLPSNSIP